MFRAKTTGKLANSVWRGSTWYSATPRESDQAGRAWAIMASRRGRLLSPTVNAHPPSMLPRGDGMTLRKRVAGVPREVGKPCFFSFGRSIIPVRVPMNRSQCCWMTLQWSCDHFPHVLERTYHAYHHACFLFALLSCLFPQERGSPNDHDPFDFFHVSFLVFEKVMRRRKAEARKVLHAR